MSPRPLQVGDICMTVNSTRPAINNGVLMVIIAVNPTMRGFDHERVPYLIRRVDGQVMGSVQSNTTGLTLWGKVRESWCEGYKLKRVDDEPEAGQVAEDVQRLEEVAP